MRILFVITARGGSKGVPRKNIVKIGGLPLVAYKIISAQRCKFDNRIIVSTDDSEIADISKSFGAEVPFIRPQELASDTADSMDVVCHAMNWVSDNCKEKYDYICLLEPSSPFLTYEDINKSMQLMVGADADTMVGVKSADVAARFIHPLDSEGKLSLFYKSIFNNRNVRRQDQPIEYTLNGCIYAAKWEYFTRNKLFHSINSIPYIMPTKKSVEIDTMLDLEFARYLVERGKIDISYWK